MPVAEDVAVGQELPSLEKHLSQRRIDVYSGVRPRSIHTDTRSCATADGSHTETRSMSRSTSSLGVWALMSSRTIQESGP